MAKLRNISFQLLVTVQRFGKFIGFILLSSRSGIFPMDTDPVWHERFTNSLIDGLSNLDRFPRCMPTQSSVRSAFIDFKESRAFADTCTLLAVTMNRSRLGDA